MEQRYLKMHEVSTRSADDGSPIIEGFFVRYDDVYSVYPGATESIAPGAFTESIHGDVRALYNHNHDLILGRTSAGTLALEDRELGLWGSIKINPNDRQAMDAYERIRRGDITGASFGFDVEKESTEIKEDGSVHWTIEKINPLWEISPCVFPAYEATSVSARGVQLEEIKKRQLDEWKIKMKARLRNDGTESTDAEARN